jgi:hypothetical protein
LKLQETLRGMAASPEVSEGGGNEPTRGHITCWCSVPNHQPAGRYGPSDDLATVSGCLSPVGSRGSGFADLRPQQRGDLGKRHGGEYGTYLA